MMKLSLPIVSIHWHAHLYGVVGRSTRRPSVRAPLHSVYRRPPWPYKACMLMESRGYIRWIYPLSLSLHTCIYYLSLVIISVSYCYYLLSLVLTLFLLILHHSFISACHLAYVHHLLGCVLTTLGLLVQVSEPTSNVAFCGVFGLVLELVALLVDCEDGVQILELRRTINPLHQLVRSLLSFCCFISIHVPVM